MKYWNFDCNNFEFEGNVDQPQKKGFEYLPVEGICIIKFIIFNLLSFECYFLCILLMNVESIKLYYLI